MLPTASLNANPQSASHKCLISTAKIRQTLRKSKFYAKILVNIRTILYLPDELKNCFVLCANGHRSLNDYNAILIVLSFIVFQCHLII